MILDVSNISKVSQQATPRLWPSLLPVARIYQRLYLPRISRRRFAGPLWGEVTDHLRVLRGLVMGSFDISCVVHLNNLYNRHCTENVCVMLASLQWRHIEHDDVSNRRRLDGSLNPLFRRRSNKTSKLRALAFVGGIHGWLMNSYHKGPVKRKMFPFDDLIMVNSYYEKFTAYPTYHLNVASFVFCWALLQVNFTHTLQGCFIGTEAMIL